MEDKMFSSLPNNTGQPSSVPKICLIPKICDISNPIVTANWLTVPKPPLKLSGDISDIYIGTNDVFSPATQSTLIRKLQVKSKDLCELYLNFQTKTSILLE